MKNYEKPIVLANSELSEGVYAASGKTEVNDHCYDIDFFRHQIGTYTYEFTVDADHIETHHSTEQILTIEFDRPVMLYDYTGSGQLISASVETTTLKFKYQMDVNGSARYIHFGTIKVRTDEIGLSVTAYSVSCRHN